MNATLQHELKNGVHALSIVVSTFVQIFMGLMSDAASLFFSGEDSLSVGGVD